MSLRILGSCLLLCFASTTAACGEDARSSGSVETGEGESDLTAATAARLGVPLEVLSAVFYVKPSPIDQSGLGVVLAPGVAFARGASSQALPTITTLDRKPFAALPSARVSLSGDDRFDALVDFDGATDASGARLVDRRPPPLFDRASLRTGMTCRVLGTDMDMYANGPPKVMSLEGTIERAGERVLVKTTRSTGGDGTLLVCEGKLAGVQAGAGSQGTFHEFCPIDAPLVAAFEHARDEACRRASRCR